MEPNREQPPAEVEGLPSEIEELWKRAPHPLQTNR